MTDESSPAPGREALARSIPSVDRCLALDGVRSLLEHHPRSVVVRAIRETLAELRERLFGRGAAPGSASRPGEAELVDAFRRRVGDLARPSFRRVVNATGIILHTGLGRAVMPESVRREVLPSVGGYALVEVDPESGERTVRTHALRDLLRELTGAESATVVNNNAAATMIILNTLAEGREVIISRGQLVEIGGSYRLPDVMAKSGVVLVGIGTTNRTHLRDYVAAIGENTGALFRAHTSNYKVVGFTASVPIEDLVRIGREHEIPVVDDLGSGALVDLTRYGFPEEPVVRKSVEAGADLVCFSGDKLIGGPQAGFIVGKREWIDRIEKNPLARAFRLDKLALAGIEATLRLFLDEERLVREHPTMRMLSLPIETIEERARALAATIREAAPRLMVEIREETSQLGSGSLPTEEIPTRVVALRSASVSPDRLARELRVRDVPIFTRVKNDEVLLDPRTLQQGEDAEVAAALADVLGRQDGREPAGS
jgi:L-seryl-tRNA(Ser) seleniumtransferase